MSLRKEFVFEVTAMPKYTKYTPPPGYRGSEYYLQKYRLRPAELKHAREKGLKFLKVGSRYYYKEQELNDFYAGKYGLPEEGEPDGSRDH